MPQERRDSTETPKVKKSFIEKTLGQSVRELHVSEGTKAGDNNLGNVLAVRATTKSKKDVHLIYKGMPNLSAEKRQRIIEAGFFRTEIALYQTVVPRVEELLKSHGVDSLPLPKYYGGKNDDKEDYLVLEDLRHLGYRMADKNTGLNLGEVILTMKALGDFHATTYCFVREAGERLFRAPEMKSFVDGFFLADDPQRSRRRELLLRLNLDNVVALLRENRYEELAEKVGRHATDEGLYRMRATTTGAADGRHFPCLVHGDLWVNNILFRYGGNSRDEPVDVKFIDFQLARRSHIYEDLGYFFLSSTTREFRERHLAHALFVYYEAFAGRLDRLQCPMPANFSRGVLVDGYYGHLLPTFAFACFTLPVQLCEPSDVSAMDAGNQKRNDDALDSPSEKAVPKEHSDLYVQAQYLLRQMRKSPWVVHRIIEITQELAALNVF